MPRFGITQNVQAKLDPTGTYLVYCISGNGRDRYERRKVNEVESGVDHTYGRAGSFPLSKASATAMGWNDRYVMQGCVTSVIDFWRYTGTADRTTLPGRTEAGPFGGACSQPLFYAVRSQRPRRRRQSRAHRVTTAEAYQLPSEISPAAKHQ